MRGRQIQLLDGVDFVIEELERPDVREAVEGVRAHDAQVGLLERERRDVRQPAERERRQLGQVHVGQLQLGDRVHAEERVRIDEAQPRRQQQVLDVRQPRERGRFQPDHRIVRQQNHFDVRRARERIRFHAQNFIVRQQYRRDVLQAGECKLRDGRQRRVLDRDLPQLRQTAECERLNRRDVVPVQGDLFQCPQPGERVALDDWEVIFGQREILDGRRKTSARYFAQAARIAQHLRTMWKEWLKNRAIATEMCAKRNQNRKTIIGSADSQAGIFRLVAHTHLCLRQANAFARTGEEGINPVVRNPGQSSDSEYYPKFGDAHFTAFSLRSVRSNWLHDGPGACSANRTHPRSVTSLEDGKMIFILGFGPFLCSARSRIFGHLFQALSLGICLLGKFNHGNKLNI